MIILKILLGLVLLIVFAAVCIGYVYLTGMLVNFIISLFHHTKLFSWYTMDEHFESGTYLFFGMVIAAALVAMGYVTGSCLLN